MSFILSLSIFMKAIAAILEILVQYLITKQIGIEGYGNYIFYIGIIDISFWILFSGIIKSNTYYLSDFSTSIKLFKKKYYIYYVFPTFCILFIISVFYSTKMLFIPIILLLYLLMMDKSSELLARGNYVKSFLGEYIIGRSILLIFLLGFIFTKQTSITLLLILYGIQYFFVLMWFKWQKKNTYKQYMQEKAIDINKLWQFQQSDIATGLINQSPVILQYIFVNTYETGFIGIVLLIKKIVNFITGPTAKVFLPQFSKLYKQKKIDEICDFFKIIIQLQMLFISVIAVILLGFPDLILSIFSPQLVEFNSLFRAVSIAFLFVSSLGPGSGLLQMTDNEKLENYLRWGTILVMGLVCFIMRENRLFALYGMCAQALSEGILKYIFVCKWFKRSPISLLHYIFLWLPSVMISIIAVQGGFNSSFFAMMICVILTFILTSLFQLCDPKIRNKVFQKSKTLFRGAR